MARRLPPLNALRAFEAAARQLSFTRAAAELNVTQAAVSHQVKALEGWLGVQLFRRLNRRLMLTDAGQAYLPPLREAFELMAQASERVRAAEAGGALKVSVLPSFGAKWLLPRLSRFRDRHPEIDVLVSASNLLVDFGRDDVDLAIRYGWGKYPGLRTDFLMGDEVFPVCSPALLEGPHPLRSPADLRYHTLLHDDVARGDESDDWSSWLRRVGVEGVDAERGPGFSDSSMVLSAAIAAQGVALGRGSLALDDLAAGRLVIPFGPIVTSALSYYLVCPPAVAERPKARRFREWLLEEAAASESQRAAITLAPSVAS